MDTKLLDNLENAEQYFYQRGMKLFSRSIREAITKLAAEVDPVKMEGISRPEMIEDLLEIDYLLKEINN